MPEELCTSRDFCELAEEFEDEGYSPDSELVEILDSVSYDKSEVQKTFIKKLITERIVLLRKKVMKFFIFPIKVVP